MLIATLKHTNRRAAVCSADNPHLLLVSVFPFFKSRRLFIVHLRHTTGSAFFSMRRSADATGIHLFSQLSGTFGFCVNGRNHVVEIKAYPIIAMWRCVHLLVLCAIALSSTWAFPFFQISNQNGDLYVSWNGSISAD